MLKDWLKNKSSKEIINTVNEEISAATIIATE